MTETNESVSGNERPWLLALDTSTGQAGVALTNGQRLLEVTWDAGRAQTTSLLREVDHLMQLASAKPEEVGAVAVAIGPGSFTGLRVGLSVAKGLALAQGAAVIGVPTLEIAAAVVLALDPSRSVVSVAPAGRGRVVWQRYGPGKDPEVRNTSLPELLEEVRRQPETVIAGELSPDQRQELVADGVALLPASYLARRPAVLADLGFARWAAGDVDDGASLEPTYVHGLAPGGPPGRQ